MTAAPAPVSTLARIALIATGGAVGTAARLGLAMLVADAAGLPLSVFIANLVGALLLGLLVARPFAASEWGLLLGTGLLGGFTTYSAFAVGTLQVWAESPVLAGVYAVATVALGLGAAALGLRLGRQRLVGVRDGAA